jgi:hypothetical protein
MDCATRQSLGCEKTPYGVTLIFLKIQFELFLQTGCMYSSYLIFVTLGEVFTDCRCHSFIA